MVGVVGVLGLVVVQVVVVRPVARHAINPRRDIPTDFSHHHHLLGALTKPIVVGVLGVGVLGVGVLGVVEVLVGMAPTLWSPLPTGN